MTLIMFWRNGPDIVVIADTQLSFNSKPTVDSAPKIFAIPIAISAGAEPKRYPDMGFAFAGHTAAGQMTHALGSAGCRNLVGDLGSAGPSVKDVADYFSRCAVEVGNAILQKFPTGDCAFEGLVFGLEGGQAVAYSFELGKGMDRMMCKAVEKIDFDRCIIHGIGVGLDRVTKFFTDSFDQGVKAHPLDALAAMIADDEYPTIGGRIQAAIVGQYGVELKPVLWIDVDGRGNGGYMGFDQMRLGAVGEFSPLSTGTFVIGPLIHATQELLKNSLSKTPPVAI